MSVSVRVYVHPLALLLPKKFRCRTALYTHSQLAGHQAQRANEPDPRTMGTATVDKKDQKFYGEFVRSPS